MRRKDRQVLPGPDTPAPAVSYILFLHVLAGVVLLFSGSRQSGDIDATALSRCALLIGLAAANVEAGRLAEGGRVDRDRPHKSLSAWSFAGALILPLPLAMLIAVPTYWHARRRGIRLPLWK